MKYIQRKTFESERVQVLTMNYKSENRLNPDLVAELMEALDEIERDKTVKALVVTGGDPKYFCNGLDLEWMMMHVADLKAIADYMKQVNALYKRVTVYPKPIVAALNGHAFGGGMFLAAHMDFRFMREDRGWVCLPEVDINIPLLPGMIAILEAVLPKQSFHAFYYTGKRFSGKEAMDMGYVESIHPEAELLPKSVEFAAMLAQKKTATYAEMKLRIRSEIARVLDEVDPQYIGKTLAFSMPEK